MGDSFLFSSELLRFERVAVSHSDIESSIQFYYTAPLIEIRAPKFIGCSISAVQDEQKERLEDLDKNSVLSVLAALEASFRTDYIIRCQKRKKDDLSRTLRSIYQTKEVKASLENDILEAWKTHFTPAKPLLSELKGALRYRHWLAHGRYWIPKVGKKYDFLSVYLLAQALNQELPLFSPE